VTLHVMNDKFDAGPIIAVAMLDQTAWRSKSHFLAAMSGAMSVLVKRELPAWCSGARATRPQSTENRAWAGVAKEGYAVSPDWTFERLDLAARFLAKRTGLFVEAKEKRAYVGRKIVQIGAPTGEPVRIGNAYAEFDVLDARVRARNELPFIRPFIRLAEGFEWARLHPLPPLSVN
jgi:methionyl-tRNA formyltransferase